MFSPISVYLSGLPWWLNGKESTCQSRRRRFDPWVGKICWRRKWQPTPVFLPGTFHEQRSLSGYGPQGRKRLTHNLATKKQQHLFIYLSIYLPIHAFTRHFLKVDLTADTVHSEALETRFRAKIEEPAPLGVRQVACISDGIRYEVPAGAKRDADWSSFPCFSQIRSQVPIFVKKTVY